MSTIILFLIALIVLVVIHELGHFFAAKAFGVRVEEFGIGYPPRARKLFRWKGTLFTLNWLPFGGFVKIFGEESAGDTEDAERERKARSFAYQKLWKRLVIVAAGVAANVLLAAVLYAGSFAVGFLGTPGQFPGAIQTAPAHVVVTEILAGSPAARAGVKPGDSVLSLTSGADHSEPGSTGELTAFIRAHADSPIEFDILRGKQHVELSIRPEAGVSDGHPGIGVSISEAARMRMPVIRAIGMGFAVTLFESKAVISSLGHLASSAFTGTKGAFSDISGPIGIAKFAGTAASLGFGSFLAFMAIISVNLAVINLLPFPALDGGRFILELFAKGGRSRIPYKVVNAINQFGFLILILLMVFVTYKDIARLVA